MEDRLGLGLQAAAAIRWRSPRRRSICRRGAPAGWRATIFLDVLKRDAAILPRIVPIGDVDEDELAFAEAATGEIAGAALDLPEALGGLERRLLLAQLILKWAATTGDARRRRCSAGRQQPGRGAGARRRSRAADGRHDDAAGRRGSRLDDLVPDELDEYWQLHARLPEDRARALAARSWTSTAHRAGRAPRPADRGRSQAPCDQRRPGDRRRLDRLDPGDREAARHHRQAAARRAWCCPASTPISTRRPGQMIAGGDADSDAAHGHPQFAMQALLRASASSATR